jgi:hypothetical protein
MIHLLLKRLSYDRCKLLPRFDIVVMNSHRAILTVLQFIRVNPRLILLFATAAPASSWTLARRARILRAG